MRVIILMALLFGMVQAQNREALLIANSSYEYIDNLKDVSGAVGKLKGALKAVGFNVKVKKNLNAKELKQAIDKFQERLARNRNTIGFFYYAGHGCQVDNVGYLVPTNVDIQKKIDIKYDALNIDKMIETFDSAGNKLNMFFLDACRNIPTGARGGTRGLAQAPLTPKGTLIVYATEAGRTADDNTNFINSLVSNLKQPNQSIKDMADNISNSVADKTQERQIPVVFYKRLPRPKVVLKVDGGGSVVPPVVTSKWIVPTNSTCTANGGKLYNGVCQANWKDATKICSASGGRLPRREELKQAVVDCGGSFTTYGDKDWDSLTDKNIANKSYQSCYKKKGFSDNDWYWTAEEKDSSYAWYVFFSNGYDYWGNKTGHGYALCVR